MLFACNLPQNSPRNVCILSMEKTACPGFCPVYSIYVYENGKVTYQGKEHVSLQGKYYAHISRHRLDQLEEAFKKAGFWGMKDMYRSLAMDLPTTCLNFSYKGQSKKIVDYDGAPEQLKSLESQVELLINELRWKKEKE